MTHPPLVWSESNIGYQIVYIDKNTVIIFFGVTLNSWTPMQANMNCRRVVTIMMFPMVLMATNTHWTTCWNTVVRMQRVTKTF